MGSFRKDNFSTKQVIVSMLSKRMQGIVYTSRQGLTKGMKRKGGLGFLPGGEDTEEFRFLRSLDFSGKCVYDIGGFQGLLSIFFAKTARKVITYEANPANVLRIYENAALNQLDNIFVRGAAIGSKDDVLDLFYEYPFDGAATGDPEAAAYMKQSGADVHSFSVVMTTLDNDVTRFGLPEPDFIKIDIEAMEVEALRGMASILESRGPDLYLELHGTTEENKRATATEAIDLIRNRGYRIYDVEQGRMITSDAPTGRESHIHCTRAS